MAAGARAPNVETEGVTDDGGETMSLELAILTFPHPEGAERAFAHVAPTAADPPWLHELAFVERHRHDRITVRGTFAGRYVDIEGAGDVIGRDTIIGALTGAVVGAAFGPPGFAAGLVAGGALGGYVQSKHVPETHSELLEQIRVHVAESASAIVLLAAREHIDAMFSAFEGSGGEAYRRALTKEQAEQLQAGLTGAPPAPPLPVAPA